MISRLLPDEGVEPLLTRHPIPATFAGYIRAQHFVSLLIEGYGIPGYVARLQPRDQRTRRPRPARSDRRTPIARTRPIQRVTYERPVTITRSGRAHPSRSLTSPRSTRSAFPPAKPEASWTGSRGSCRTKGPRATLVLFLTESEPISNASESCKRDDEIRRAV